MLFRKGEITITYLSRQYFTIILDLTFQRSQESLHTGVTFQLALEGVCQVENGAGHSRAREQAVQWRGNCSGSLLRLKENHTLTVASV